MGRFYAAQELSENQSKTPEGYLLCEGVAIARTGDQVYACTEVPIEPTSSGLILVKRDPEQVFRAETIASFEGKPVTLGHEGTVDPENWQDLARGTVQNVRRGVGIEDDYLFADLLITDADAIKAVAEKKLVQVSCGYDAEYEQIEPGVGRQLNIVGNHVALVERGRAGPRCAIKDEEIIMPKPATKAPAQTWWDKVAPAFLQRDAKALRAHMRDADGPGDDKDDEDDTTKDDVENLKKTCDALQKTVDAMPATIAAAVKAAMKDAAEEETAEEKAARLKKEGTGDDVALAAQQAEKLDGGEVMTGDALVGLMSRVEILAPGTAVPTGDSVKTKGLAGRIMRAALVKATADAKTGPAIAPLVAGVDVKTITYDALRPLFSAAVEVARITNNTSGRNDQPRTTKDFGRAISPAEMSAQNAAFWNKTGK